MKRFTDHTPLDLLVVIARLAANAGFNDGETQANGKAYYPNDGDARRVDRRLFAVMTDEEASAVAGLVIDAYERGFALGVNGIDEVALEDINFESFVHIAIGDSPALQAQADFKAGQRPHVVKDAPPSLLKDGRLLSIAEHRWRGPVGQDGRPDAGNDMSGGDEDTGNDTPDR